MGCAVNCCKRLKDRYLCGMRLWHYKLLDLMKAMDENQSDVARVAGVAPSAVSKWLDHGGNPKVVVMIRLADHYRVSLDQLFRPEMSLPAELTRTVAVRPVDRSPDAALVRDARRALSAAETRRPARPARPRAKKTAG